MTAYLRRAGFEIRRIDYAADHLHVGYVCMPAPDYLPPDETVTALWREVQFVQNVPRGA